MNETTLKRFARLAKASSETQRLRLIEEGQPFTSKSWNKRPLDPQQLAYTEVYQAEYEVGSTESAGEENDQVASLTETSNKLRNLISMRGRRSRSVCSTKSSVVNFDVTSTVVPPSEVVPEEHTSNVSAEELRRDYFGHYKPKTNLPIHAYRQQLLDSINSYSVVIVDGNTGCGKTTQVPVFILEDAILERKTSYAPVIYVTQPRKIAARSIAQRICEEHDWQLGSIVGYQVGLDKVVGPQTVLVFCTAGVLLQKLIEDKSLKSYTHIIVDEVHERDADTDLLLMMIRTLMRKEQSFFRLIVMSATMDMNKLKNYFTFRTNYGHKALTTPSICKITQEKRLQDVQIIYFDALKTTYQLDVPMPIFDLEQPELHEECLEAAKKIIVNIIPLLDTYSEISKSTLVFLPGLAEISKLDSMLKQVYGLEVIPLHSCIAIADQHKVFLPSQPHFRKVILATNIAESSITVKDVGFIIDFCLTKVLTKDEVTKFPTLKLQWSTQDKSTQRSGRTGRCCRGKVFRMVSNDFFKAFDYFAVPELLVTPLELSVLRVKKFNMGEVKALLAIVLDPPPFDDIRTAVLELKQIGGLSAYHEGKLSDIDGDLTELGRVLAALPIDVHLSKLIYLAAVFDVLEDAITVAACLSTNRSVVKHSFNQMLVSYTNKLDWAHGSYSDLLVCLDVYKEYKSYALDQCKDATWMQKYCYRRNLDERKLHEVTSLVHELRVRLEGLNISIIDQPNRLRNRFEDELMLKVAFCGAFYPNYFISKEFDVDVVQKQLCGLDPTKTLIIGGFPVNSVPLYRSQILNQFHEFEADIEYIADCSRALLQINDSTEMDQGESMLKALGQGVISKSRPISRSVYRAVKAGESMSHRLCIREYQDKVARERMDFYKRKRELTNVGHSLKPSWTKIVSNRPVDNSQLMNASSETPFLEVEFNVEQDALDLDTLHDLEQIEEEIRIMNRRSHDDRPNEHPIFKQGYKPIKGPESPIRVQFSSIQERSKSFNVELDSMSVNCVLLDPEYHEEKRQMLVAASVGQSRSGRVLARDTTLMPNIRGLPILMSLIFAQHCKLIYNDTIKCIVGAIFGIGWDVAGESMDRTYEVELGFDVHITNDDLVLINEARKLVYEIIKFTHIQNPGAPMVQLQVRLRQIILSLIRRRRYPMDPVSITHIPWQEGHFSKGDYVPESLLGELKEGETRPFLPLIETCKPYSELDMYDAMREVMNKTARIANGDEPVPVGGYRCWLCSGLGHFMVLHHEVVDHYQSKAHRKKLDEFEMFEAIARNRA